MLSVQGHKWTISIVNSMTQMDYKYCQFSDTNGLQVSDIPGP